MTAELSKAVSEKLLSTVVLRSPLQVKSEDNFDIKTVGNFLLVKR